MVTFMLAILLFAVLLFTDKVRVHKIATLLLTVIIVSPRPLHCTCIPESYLAINWSHNKHSI